MNLARQLLHQIADQSLSTNKRAQLRCELAKQLEESGDYDAAREAMGELWKGVGERPEIQGLDQETAAEVLVRAGALTGWIGSTRQIEGSQEAAKDLITESIVIFSALANIEKLSGAQTDLAYCYWREGSLDEARVVLHEALARLAYSESETKAVALLRSGIVEGSAQRFHDAFRIFTEAAPLMGKSSDLLRGKFHHGFGTLLKKLGEAEQRHDYIDRALIEFAAASFHFEQGGHSRHEACVENNLGFLFCTIGKLAEAHEHLDRAQALFTTLKDKVHLAQVDETRARVMLAEGRIVDAEKLVSGAARMLEKGGEQSLFAEALSTHGIALARLHDLDRSRVTLQRAVEVADQAGDPEHAGQAALVMVEELFNALSHSDLKAAVDRAWELLQNTQDVSTLKRVTNCTRRVLSLIHASARFPGSIDWTNFSFNDEIQRYEAHFIRLALRDSGGKVTRAAQLLGLPGHQNLLCMLETRHKHLLSERLPKRSRKSVIRHRDVGRSRKRRSRKARTVKILHVEDDPGVAGMMKETLSLEGWDVEMCAEGTAAMAKINSHTHYDLLLLDYDLPGTNGVQLVQQARRLAHRRAIPIIILSATLDETAAHMAGADASLRKPEDISAVAETVARLLRSTKE
ncbi:MAG: putative two-component response regulator transcriptional regulatory protein [Acidobacteria bacterium]|nr:putative two-component response regulator transcriptional regulatory protein [Acidobacteriota bacterium]